MGRTARRDECRHLGFAADDAPGVEFCEQSAIRRLAFAPHSKSPGKIAPSRRSDHDPMALLQGKPQARKLRVGELAWNSCLAPCSFEKLRQCEVAVYRQTARECFYPLPRIEDAGTMSPRIGSIARLIFVAVTIALPVVSLLDTQARALQEPGCGGTFEPGDTVFVIMDASAMKLGQKTRKLLSRSTKLQVIEVKGDWIGGTAEVDGETVRGWVHREQTQPG